MMKNNVNTLRFVVIYMDDNIGFRLKKLRMEHNYAQIQTANFLNINQEEITKLEINEVKLTYRSLDKLCKLYKCSPEYILKGEGEYTKLDYDGVDLETVAKMNTIIFNLKILSKLDKIS